MPSTATDLTPSFAPPAEPIKLYYSSFSGHANRVLAFLSILGLPHETVPVDLRAGAQKQPAFLQKNAFGQVPVIEDGAVVLADSAAILVYLAKRYDASGRWLPQDPVGAAQVQRWLSVAAGQLVNGPGAAWVSSLFGKPTDDKAIETAKKLLTVMDAHLAQQPYLATTDAPTIADLAVYTYTVLGPAGGVSIAPYPNVLAWVQRLESVPGFVRQADAPALPIAA
jgi:glutathione S-transferase